MVPSTVSAAPLSVKLIGVVPSGNLNFSLSGLKIASQFGSVKPWKFSVVACCIYCFIFVSSSVVVIFIKDFFKFSVQRYFGNF